MHKVSVVVVSPSEFFRKGARHLLRDTVYEVVADLPTSTEMVPAELRSAVNVLVWGPGTTDNIEGEASELRRLFAAGSARLVVVMNTDDVQAVRRVATLGVDAILPYNISAEVFPRMIDVVLLGQQIFPSIIVRAAEPRIVNSMIAERSNGVAFTDPSDEAGLTEREAQVLTCIVNGASNKSIGRQLSLTEPTVKAHVKAMFRKIGVSNRTQAAVWATNQSWSAHPLASRQ